MERVIQLQIETTSVCNAKCHFCLYPVLDRKREFMDLELFTKIISEAATIPQIWSVCLTGLGESMLDPHLEARIRLVRSLLPSETFVDVFTNGTYLTPARFDSLRDAGLDCVSISLNAASAAKRKEIMGLDDWTKVISNIQYALTHRNGMKVQIKAVVNEDKFTQDEATMLQALWGNPLLSEGEGHFVPVMEGNWAGESRTLRDFKPNESCGRALGQIYVTVDGRVTTCCFDPIGKQTFGDLKVETLREVYNSAAYTAFRQAHFEDKADRYEICAKCTRI
jgi:radical SAM protein with 4Fe4S-binding SPASM domain